ncbi:MAG: hypothetical protein ABIB71_08985 [Candidatus Woesearchaeota archaeon]
MISNKEISDMFLSSLEHAKRILDYDDISRDEDKIKELSLHGRAVPTHMLYDADINSGNYGSLLNMIGNYISARSGRSKVHDPQDLAYFIHRESSRQVLDRLEVYKEEMGINMGSYRAPFFAWTLLGFSSCLSLLLLNFYISIPVALIGSAIAFKKTKDFKKEVSQMKINMMFREHSALEYLDIRKEKFQMVLDSNMGRIKEILDTDFSSELFPEKP